MKPSVLLLIISITSINFLSAQTSPLFIENVSYINVETGKIQKANIYIEDGKIKSISKRKSTETNIRKIDGAGKWLIPGLVDAHIHLFQSGGLYTRPDVIDLRHIRDYETERNWLKDQAGNILRRYLQNGITTVIDVGGPFYNYEIKKQYNDNALYPNLYLTGPLISTYQPEEFQIEDAPILKVKTTEEAVELVQEQLKYDPDFIKIWYISLPNLSAESTYDIVAASIKESHKHNKKVAVHATELNTAKLAIKAGADILVHSVDDPVDEDFIKMLKDNDVVYIPTLVVHENYIKTFEGSYEATDLDYATASPIPLGSLMDVKHLKEEKQIVQYQQYMPMLKTRLALQDSGRLVNLKTLSNHPITLATGTDAGNIGTMHGSSYFDELALMQKAGLSNLQILQASTINGAKVLGKQSEFGSIVEGKMADLVLLNNNPLEDLNALKDISQVIKKGRVYSVENILKPSPEELVQMQLNAYNARNLEAFLTPYSDDVEIYNYPGELTAKGKEKIRPQYESMFKNYTDLHCELVNRIVQGNTVIDQERVTGIPNMEVLEAIAIYKIKDGKIAEVHFIY